MNIFTLDVEEWYIYSQHPKGGEAFYLPIINTYLDNILDKLESTGSKGTFFCLGSIARNNPEVIKLIDKRGHEIGCHSDKHILVTDMNPKQFEDDSRMAIDGIEQLIGKKVQIYRAPAFSIREETKWALEVLISLGITYDSSLSPGKFYFNGIDTKNLIAPFIVKTKSGTIKEFPINYYNLFSKNIVFSGGGYFRFFPYWFIKMLTKKSPYNMTYFHIRDFDKYQKRINFKNYFYSYYGIRGAYNKLENYMSDFKFISIIDAANKFNWENAKIIEF